MEKRTCPPLAIVGTATVTAPGTCLLPGDQGLCRHKPVPSLTFRERVALLGNRRFWHRAFWGVRDHARHFGG